MRLDAFLKNTRLMRRSVAKRLAESGLILVNGKTAKAARDVKDGDMVTIVGPDGVNRSVKVLKEAVRPVPRGREGEFFEDG